MLIAMGGYGTYLGFRIRFSDDVVSASLIPVHDFFQEDSCFFINFSMIEGRESQGERFAS